MKKSRVIVVDDSPEMAETIAAALMSKGYDTVPVHNVHQAARLIGEAKHDALVSDLRMPGGDGLELLELSRSVAPEAPVIIMTAFSGIDSAVESIRRGAYHYITKPFKMDELALFVSRGIDDSTARREARTLKRTLRETLGLDTVIGDSQAMREVVKMVRRVADADAPVLILGETGTGKGLLARALHAESSRAARPFVAVNCGAIPETLLESELFGHAKGAFTGATASRPGIFEEADGGTLFLDEIGEMQAALQVKLLHVIETGRFRPVGETREREVDVRIVAATHRNLTERARQGTFREDLLYRLDVVSIDIPPLRHRISDIPRLAEHFLKLYSKRPLHFTPDALEAMLAYAWPGNIRELEHAIERAVLLAPHEEIRLTDLPKRLTAGADGHALDFGDEILPLRELSRRYVTWAYRQAGNKKQAAERLGIDFKTLVRWLSADEMPASLAHE